jgi:hypothetical protein
MAAKASQERRAQRQRYLSDLQQPVLLALTHLLLILVHLLLRFWIL